MNIKNMISKNIICCDINSSIQEIASTMKRYDIGWIPIHDKKKIVGIITDRDIVTGMLSNHENSHSKIQDYMTKNIISIPIQATLEEVLEKMAKHKIKRILITSNQKVEGVISLSDILNINNHHPKVWETIQNIYATSSTSHMKTEIDEFYL